MAISPDIYSLWFALFGGGNSPVPPQSLYAQFLFESASGNLTATGTTQATALQLANELNLVSTAANSSAPYNGVILPPAQAGLTIIVANKSSNFIQIYGNGSDTIDAQTATVGVQQMPGSMVIYSCTVLGQWISEGLGTGYSGSLQTFSFTNAVTSAGTTQATATPITSSIANVTTVASGTGVNLPASAPGLEITVINNGLNPLQVYPFQGSSDTINGIAATVGVSLIPGATATFNCTAAGAWTVQAFSSQTSASNTIASAASLTLTAASITGATSEVHITITGSTTITTLVTDTAANIVKTLHNPAVGTSYKLRIINVNSVASSALTGGTNVTVNSAGSGVVTIPGNGWRDFIVKVTSVGTPAITFTSTSTGTWS